MMGGLLPLDGYSRFSLKRFKKGNIPRLRYLVSYLKRRISDVERAEAVGNTGHKEDLYGNS
jgi:hypothetical protein